MTELIIQSGKHQGKKLVITEAEVTVGRDEQCAIRLASNDVSRHHCTLRSAPEGLFVRDLDSRNGTFVNDVQISGETLLKEGDTLRIGPMVFQVPAAKQKKTPAIQTPSAPRASGSAASDEDIASWLSIDDPDPEHAAQEGDTTIIPRLPPAEAAKAPPREPHKTGSYKTVAQEAADVIRKHLEMKKQQNRID
jgi:pSer/pThr/pTyr-binding forkhead associated (FHA) protein